jgi:hypothetical protein
LRDVAVPPKPVKLLINALHHGRGRRFASAGSASAARWSARRGGWLQAAKEISKPTFSCFERLPNVDEMLRGRS